MNLYSCGHPPTLSPRVRETIGAVLDDLADSPRPAYLVDLGKIPRNLEILRQYFPDIPIHYAVKANGDPRILATMHAAGSGFEAASPGEVRRLLGLGVPPEQIIYGNPCLPETTIRFLLEHGIDYFVVESLEALRQVTDLSGTRNIFLRLNLCEHDARHVDYGATKRYIETRIATAGPIVRRIRGLCYYGVHRLGLDLAAEVMERWLPHIDTVNIGGALLYPELSAELDAEAASGAFTGFRHLLYEFAHRRGVKLMMEPGGALVNNAVHALSRIVYTSSSAHSGFAMHIDLGPTLGLRKTPPGFFGLSEPRVVTPRGSLVDASCSKRRIGSFSPCPVYSEGDRLLFANVGMYSQVHLCESQLLDWPEVVYWSDNGSLARTSPGSVREAPSHDRGESGTLDRMASP